MKFLKNLKPEEIAGIPFILAIGTAGSFILFLIGLGLYTFFTNL